MEWITLALAVWGAALSTYLGFYKRRRRLLVAADFGVARLGSIRRHGFFVVTAVNVGERAVTIREIEWEVDRDFSFTTHIFKHSKGKDLPVQVDPDEEVRILFDIDAASKHIATTGATAIKVDVAGAKRAWRVEIGDETRSEAEDLIEQARQ